MTQSPNEAKSVRDVLEKLKNYYAVSVDKSEILNVDEALAALRSLIEKEVIGEDVSEDSERWDSETGACDGCGWFVEDGSDVCPCILKNQLKTEQRAKLKEVMGGE